MVWGIEGIYLSDKDVLSKTVSKEKNCGLRRVVLREQHRLHGLGGRPRLEATRVVLNPFSRTHGHVIAHLNYALTPILGVSGATSLVFDVTREQ